MGNQEFSEIATRIIADKRGLRRDQVYVVWLVKVLQNNKALLATTESDGMYYEITYDGDKEQFYVDDYKKEKNEAIDVSW